MIINKINIIINSNTNTMGTFDFIEVAKNYLEKTAEDFLEHFGLKDSFPKIVQNAYCKSCQTMRLEDYFNTISNEVVGEVAKKTGENHNDVFDDFECYYYSRKFKS